MSNTAEKELFKESLRNYLAPVYEYLEDPTVTEILINGIHDIFIERGGTLHKTPAKFPSEDDLLAGINNIAQFVKRRITTEEPRLDARLPDGSRIHAVIRPCAMSGPTVSIRKFSKVKIDFKKYIEWGAITSDAAQFLEICMYLGKNLLVSGGTGSGKTTLLGLLCSRIPAGKRLIVIEDSSELTVDYEHVVRFETKMADEMGKGEVTIYDLLKSSLRLRPDRIIVGEVRGAEAMELIQAMNTGHNGSMGTIHANSPADALLRLESLAMGGETKVSEKAVRQSIVSAVELIVQVSRIQGGARKVMAISEVVGVNDDGSYKTEDIYRINSLTRQPDGKLNGRIEPAGILPTFMKEIEDNRIPFPRAKFFANKKAS